MPLIWRKDGKGWIPLTSAGFKDERALHDIIEESPHTLPLSGQPSLVVLGREVQLGAEYADLIAVERSGRVVVIEIKLRKNAESRREVVSQVLSYASHLHGLTFDQFENALRPHLVKRGWSSLATALEETDQEGSFVRNDFVETLEANLKEGAFRLVIVLDEAPRDLVRIAGYLESVAGSVLVDLIGVSTFDIAGTSIIVPQRVDPEREEQEKPGKARPSASKGETSDGAEAFVESIASAPPAEQVRLKRLVEWAKSLEAEGLVKLYTYKGVSDRWTLLPYVQPDDVAGLITIWNEHGAALQFWRSVFEKKAPAFIEPLQARIGKVGQGNTVREFDEALLEVLTQAHRATAAAVLST